MTDSTWRQLQWDDARHGSGAPGTTADGAHDTYLITQIDGHIVLARWTRRDGPPAPPWWTAREALATALIIPGTPITAALLAEAYENGVSLTSRSWHHPGTDALPARDTINAAYAGGGQQDSPPGPAGPAFMAEIARLAAEGRHDGVRIRLDPRRQFATPGELDDYLHGAAGPAELLEQPRADPGPGPAMTGASQPRPEPGQPGLSPAEAAALTAMLPAARTQAVPGRQIADAMRQDLPGLDDLTLGRIALRLAAYLTIADDSRPGATAADMALVMTAAAADLTQLDMPAPWPPPPPGHTPN